MKNLQPETSRQHPKRQAAAFSLAEVAIALGIVAYSLVGVVMLLQVGMDAAKNSSDEIQAVSLISNLCNDLKNTPLTSGSSTYFGLTPVPWAPLQAGSSVAVPNRALVTGTNYVFYAENAGALQPSAAGARYRVTLEYLRAPGQVDVASGTTTPPVTSPAAIEALMTVSWPPQWAPHPTSGVGPQGLVEEYVTFQRP